MDIHYFPEPFPHIVIERFFEEDELASIWDELKFLTYAHKLQGPDRTAAASENGKDFKKNGKGIFLFDVYRNNDTSDIIRCSAKLFNKQLAEIFSNFNYLFDYVRCSNRYGLLLNYYGDGDYYLSHRDNSTMTAVITLFKEPQAFTGGDLVFSKYKHSLAPQNNRMIIFPGIIEHEVSTVHIENETPFSGEGRYSLNMFLNYE